MSVTGTLVFSWKISCANWANDLEFINISHIRINRNEMWTPIIMHYNSVDNYYLNPDNLALPYVYVESDGTAFYNLAGVFTSKCEFHFYNFPYDSQKCNVTLETADNINIILMYPFPFNRTPQNDVTGDYYFDYSKLETYNENRTYQNSSGLFSFVSYEFYFSRKSEYYVINIILPMISMMALENAAILIPIGAERCSFLLTILVSIFLIQSVVDATISHLSTTPRLAYLLLGFTISSTILCLYSIIILMMMKNNGDLSKKMVINGKFNLIQLLDIIFLLLSLLASFAMTVATFHEQIKF